MQSDLTHGAASTGQLSPISDTSQLLSLYVSFRDNKLGKTLMLLVNMLVEQVWLPEAKTS